MEDYSLNFYRKKILRDGKFLLTTDHGDWVVLTKCELEQLESGKFEDVLRLKLEEKGIILNEQNKENVIEKLRNRYLFLRGGPSLHIVVLSLRCNQRCVYCHASSVPQKECGFDMDMETAKKTIDFIFQTPSKNIAIEFQGGEPLLNVDVLRYLISYAKKVNELSKKNLEFRLVSNLKFLNDEIKRFLKKENVYVCTSLDGPKELHEYNRNIGTHEPTVKGMKKLMKEKIPLSAILTISRESLKFPKKIVDEYILLSQKSIHVRFLSNLGNAKEDWERVGYNALDFVDFWKKCLDYIIQKNLKGYYLEERGTKIILQKLFGYEPNYLELRNPCGAITGQLLYDYNGDIYTCDEARMVGSDLFKVGNVFSDTLTSVMSSPKSCEIIRSSINDVAICDSCVYKPYCGLCPVCSYAEQGSPLGNVPTTTRCKIHKAQFDYIFEKLLSDSDYKKIFLDWLK